MPDSKYHISGEPTKAALQHVACILHAFCMHFACILHAVYMWHDDRNVFSFSGFLSPLKSDHQRDVAMPCKILQWHINNLGIVSYDRHIAASQHSCSGFLV